jgi:hypothetical protein
LKSDLPNLRIYNARLACSSAKVLAMGLVDYKICSVDGVWSGMVFAVKKARG